MERINPKTIWSVKQNNPNLIVQDCVKEFNLDEKQAEKLRYILLIRGVNKWLFARRKFIQLKHKVKDLMKQIQQDSGTNNSHFKDIQWVSQEPHSLL